MFDRKTHWQNIYQDKSPLDVSWYQIEPNISLQLIHRSTLSNGGFIIDVGGGASLLVDYLCQKGFSNIAVLDISNFALASAKKRLGEYSRNIEWIETDITDFKPQHKFTVWHDRAVFHFLTDSADRKKYIETLKKSLVPGGYVIIATFAIGGPNNCSGLDIVQYDAVKLMEKLGSDFKLLDEISEIHITPDNKEQKFMYFYFQYNPNNAH